MKQIRKIIISSVVVIFVIIGVFVVKPGFAQITDSLIITPSGSLEAELNVPFTINFVASGGDAPYQWATNLPEWLDYFPKDSNGFCISEECVSQSPDKIQITGTPPAPGNYSIELATLDSFGNTGTQTFNLFVRDNSFINQTPQGQTSPQNSQSQNNPLLQIPSPDPQPNQTLQNSLEQTQEQVEQLFEEQFAQFASPVSVGASFAYIGSPAAYYLTDSGKELYSSMKVLDAWGVKLEDVITIPSSQQYNDSPKIIVSLPTGTVVKAEKNSTVYEVVSGHTLRAFSSLQSFKNSGHSLSDIITLEFSELFPYYQVIE